MVSIGSRIAKARSRLNARSGVRYSKRIPVQSVLSANILAMGPITAANVLPDPVGTWIRPLSPFRCAFHVSV